MSKTYLGAFSAGPIVRELGLRRKRQRGYVSQGGISLALTALNVAAEEMPFDEKELYRFLHFRIDTAERARQRSFWIGGRIYNTLSGQSATYVPLTGTHLLQTLACIGLEAPKQVVVQGRYAIRLDHALRAYERLKEKLKK